MMKPSGYWASAPPVGNELRGQHNYRKVIVSWLQMAEQEVSVEKECRFCVDTREAGYATPSIRVTNPNKEDINCKPEKLDNGRFECVFIPHMAGVYTVFICYNGMNIPKSPFRVNASMRRRTVADEEIMPASLRRYVKKPTTFKEKRLLGEGEFGKVFEIEAQINGIKTTVFAGKTIKYGQREILFKEAQAMIMFNHPNVLSLLAIVIDHDKLYMLMSFMDRGTLKDYLSSHKQMLDNAADLVDYAYQVACGMEHISSVDYIHRDLAARNCLLNTANLVKIADFGLARDTFITEYRMANVQNKLPLCWIAPEVLEEMIFTKENDVWAFGVVLWEIFSFGEEPYRKVPHRLLMDFLREGNRLNRPTAASEEIYSLMGRCWHEIPSCRPSFTEICQKLEDICRRSNRLVIKYRNL